MAADLVSQTTQSPIYLDWTFWAFVVAALALVLSQLPPLRVLFRRSRLSISARHQLGVSHYLGNSNLQLLLQLSNEGPHPIRVESIELVVQREGRQPLTLPANGYFESSKDREPLVLAPFTISPGQDWTHIVNCFRYLARDEDRRIHALAQDLRANIEAKRAALPADHPDVEADAAVVAPIQEFYRTHFDWSHGEYSLGVSVRVDNRQLSKNFRFTLFESDVSALHGLTDGYRYGRGVILPTGPTNLVLVALKPHLQ